jgi:hypothetical protein
VSRVKGSTRPVRMHMIIMTVAMFLGCMYIHMPAGRIGGWGGRSGVFFLLLGCSKRGVWGYLCHEGSGCLALLLGGNLIGSALAPCRQLSSESNTLDVAEPRSGALWVENKPCGGTCSMQSGDDSILSRHPVPRPINRPPSMGS